MPMNRWFSSIGVYHFMSTLLHWKIWHGVYNEAPQEDRQLRAMTAPSWNASEYTKRSALKLQPARWKALIVSSWTKLNVNSETHWTTHSCLWKKVPLLSFQGIFNKRKFPFSRTPPFHFELDLKVGAHFNFRRSDSRWRTVHKWQEPVVKFNALPSSLHLLFINPHQVTRNLWNGSGPVSTCRPHCLNPVTKVSCSV